MDTRRQNVVKILGVLSTIIAAIIAAMKSGITG